MTIPKPIHPFPARMAPHLVLSALEALESSSVVLDPMMGSGTVVRVAARSGHTALGRDVDPLAVLMAQVWTTPIDTDELRKAARETVAAAREMHPDTIELPWIDDDTETRQFTEKWFADAQRVSLRQLSACLFARDDDIGNALRIALSRIIVTKDRGASLARDVSHSRPHKAFETNAFPVFESFLTTTERLARRLEDEPPEGRAHVAREDARSLSLDSNSVDAVVTSPPYLNAIDYIRGHRMSLVWLGHRVSELRTIRGGSIGTERGLEHALKSRMLTAAMERLALPESFPMRERRILERYIVDLTAMLCEAKRVLRPGGKIVLVIGNSCVRDVFIWNSRILSTILAHLNFRHDSHYSRELPASRRYLPPPTDDGQNNLRNRMRREVILSYTRL